MLINPYIFVAGGPLILPDLIWDDPNATNGGKTTNLTQVKSVNPVPIGKVLWEITTTGTNSFGGACNSSGLVNPLGAAAEESFSARLSGQKLAAFSTGWINQVSSVWAWTGQVLTIAMDLLANPPTASLFHNGVPLFTFTLPPGVTWYPAYTAYTGSAGSTSFANVISYPVDGYANWT